MVAPLTKNINFKESQFLLHRILSTIYNIMSAKIIIFNFNYLFCHQLALVLHRRRSWTVADPAPET